MSGTVPHKSPTSLSGNVCDAVSPCHDRTTPHRTPVVCASGREARWYAAV